ncbi:MAG TPA: VanW family protein [Patescibacteria group bacterium]
MTSASNSLNSLRPDSGAQIAPLATHNMSLEKRYGNTFVNDVFKDNILLTLNYMDGKVKAASDINWAEVEKPAKYEFTLKPGEEFTFHDQVLAAYKGNIVKSTNAHFNYTDGFKSDGYLTGDGVCHLASLIYWTAKDAGLTAIAPRNHDFANIPEVPREYGVSIYDLPGDPGSSQYQNLYITNNKEKDVKFVFEYKDNILTISVVEKE